MEGMEAALSGRSEFRSGTSRILAHCAGLARITGEERATAQVRLESALGDDFARRLVGTLVAEGGHEHARRLA